jgi:hypothetical protein
MSNIDFLKGYPYTSKHALNADWLVERTQAVENAVDGVVAEAREIVADTEAAVTVMKTEFQGEVTTAKNDIAEDAGIAQAEISQSVNAGKASVQQQADAYTASSTFQNMVQQTANTQIAAYVNGQGLAAIQAAIDARIAGTAMQAIIANESPASRENAKQVNFLNGWQQGYTVNASGALAADALYIASNYIAVTPGEVVRLCHMDPPLQWNGMQDHYFYNGTTFVTKISAASTEPDRPVTVPAGVTQMRICMTLARYNISPYWMLCKNYKPARYVAPETATLVYTMTNKDMNRTRQYCGTVKYLTSPFQDIVMRDRPACHICAALFS